MLNQLDDLNARGRNVLTLESGSPGETILIGRAACEGLTDDPDIARAGILINAGEVTGSQLGTNVPFFRASSTLFPELRNATILLGANLPAASARPHHMVVEGVVMDSAPLAEQPEGIRVNQSVVTGLPPQIRDAETCLVVLEPRADPVALVPRIEAGMTVHGASVHARPTMQETTSLLRAYRDRLTRLMPFGVGLIGAGIAFLIARARAREYAAYRLTGASRIDVLTLTVLEQGAVALAGLLAGLSAAAISASAFPGYSTVAALLVTQTATWTVATTAATLPFALANPARLTRTG